MSEKFSPELGKEKTEVEKLADSVKRFVKKEIEPLVAAFVEGLPTVHEISEMPVRNRAEGLELLAQKKYISEFLEGVRARFEAYSRKVLDYNYRLGPDAQAECALVFDHIIDRCVATLELLKLTIDQKFDELVDAAVGPVEFDGEQSSIEKTIAEAGEKFNTPVTQLMRR